MLGQVVLLRATSRPRTDLVRMLIALTSVRVSAGEHARADRARSTHLGSAQLYSITNVRPTSRCAVVTSHCIALHYIALHRIALHHIASHHLASHRITSHRIASHHNASHRKRQGRLRQAGDCPLPAPQPRADDPRCGARFHWPLQASDGSRSPQPPPPPLPSGRRSPAYCVSDPASDVTCVR